jgi:hypothetical protein
MSAIRVIDDHNELENVGAISHQQLDDYINNSRWLVYSGSGPLPSSALTLVAGEGIQINENQTGQLVITNTTPSLPSTNVSWNFMEAPSGEADDYNKTFYLAHSPYPTNSLMFFVNGILQAQGENLDYTLQGNCITTVNPVLKGSKVVSTYSYQVTGGNIAWMETVSGTKDGMNLVFEISKTPNPSSSLMLFFNGVLQMQDYDYYISGKSIVMLSAPQQNANLLATYSY